MGLSLGPVREGRAQTDIEERSSSREERLYRRQLLQQFVSSYILRYLVVHLFPEEFVVISSRGCQQSAMACLTSATVVLCSTVFSAAQSSVTFSKSSTARFHVAPVVVKPLTRRCNSFSVRSSAPKSSETDLQDKVAESITNAMEVCKGNETSEECVVSWDEAEELAAALADKKRQSKADPLEKYCADNPETDECRVYED